VFTVFRTGRGAVIFFVAAVYLFGIGHFQDVLAPFVWQWTALYAVLIVVGGQLAWFKGLRSCPTAQVSLATSFSPVAGVLIAYLLLGEEPGTAVLIGGAVIMAGIAVAQVGGWHRRRQAALSTQLAQEGRTGFKGI